MKIPLINKRRNFLIDPPFQIRVIKYMLVLTSLVILVFYLGNYYHFSSLRQKGLTLGLPPDHIFFRFVAEQQRTMNIFFGVTAFCALVIILGFGVYLSHQIAGPIHHAKKHLNDLGNTHRLTFRKGDFFHELAESVNKRLGR